MSLGLDAIPPEGAPDLGAQIDEQPLSRGLGRKDWLGLVLGLAALGALIAGIAYFGEAKRFVALVEQARPGWLLLALALQVLTYASEAGAWQAVLGDARCKQPFRDLYALSLVALFTNQIMPTAGIAGTFLVVRALERRGVPRPVAMSVVLIELVGYYAAFGVSVGFALFVLWRHHDLSPVVLGMALGIAALGGGLSFGALWVAAPGKKLPEPLRRWGFARRVIGALSSADPELVHHPGLLARVALLRLGNFAADALTVWACLRSVGQDTPVGEAVAAFVVGALARVLGVVPGGLGTFEGGIVGGLALFGVSVEPGLAAALLFRGLSFWLPMPPGLWLSRRLVRRPDPTGAGGRPPG